MSHVLKNLYSSAKSSLLIGSFTLGSIANAQPGEVSLAKNSFNSEETVCEVGYIDIFTHFNNGESRFEFHTDGRGFKTTVSNKDKRLLPSGKYLTIMWQTSSYSRFEEAYSTIQLAVEQRIPVRITSSDNNCAGNQDEYLIMLCTNESDCDFGLTKKD